MPSVMWQLLLVVTSSVLGETGVCNVKTESNADNKTKTEGCGVAEENSIKDDEEYAKIRWTDSEDWEIREKLDVTDELIASEPEKAIEEFRLDFLSSSAQ